MLLLSLCSFPCRHLINHSRLCVSLPRCLPGHLSPAHFLTPEPRLRHSLYLDHCIYVLSSLSLCLAPFLTQCSAARMSVIFIIVTPIMSPWCHTLQWLETILGKRANSLLSRISRLYTIWLLPNPRCCCFSQSFCYATRAFSSFKKVPFFFHGLFQCL